MFLDLVMDAFMILNRPRRLRTSSAVRDLVAETHLTASQLIAPLFIKEGITQPEPIRSMPGVFQLPLSAVLQEVVQLKQVGIKGVMLFGIPAKKDEQASGAYSANGIIQQAIKIIKKDFPDFLVIGDVCLCEYMSHGHCGLVDSKGQIDNDSSLDLLAKTALSQVEAGADIVAPSDMMDGRVGAIRSLLDERGYTKIPIMSYAVKYASAYYGPFREAAESTPHFGDRKSYQMDFRNRREALREAQLDVDEGADILMVKPAGAYLDIISDLATVHDLPIAAYQVSGEYSMIVAAADKGFLDRKATILESLTAIRRAGAQIIITYFAKEIAGSL